MSSIQQLSEAGAVSSSMQLPVYDSINGQPRRISLQQLLEWTQGNLSSDTSGPFKLSSYTVAELAAGFPPSANGGAVVYCTNGNSGSPCLAVSNGTNWLRIALGAAVSG